MKVLSIRSFIVGICLSFLSLCLFYRYTGFQVPKMVSFNEDKDVSSRDFTDIISVKNSNQFKFYNRSTTPTKKLSVFYPNLTYHIGVLTAIKYIKLRASDVYHTYGKEASSFSFYTGSGLQNYTGSLPLTSLTNVDDSVYPPQEKSFTMIKHWCEHLLPEYDWFIKVDDDTYVKIEALERFLWSLDETQKFYLGRYGMGLRHEKHLLGLYGNSFCTGPTVIYSKPMLKEICPHIDQCMKEVVTSHEDTEVGRCLISKAGVQCATNTRKPSLNSMFKQSYSRSTYLGNLLERSDLRNSITVHEVKHSEDLYNLHHYYWRWLNQHNTTKITHKSNPFNVYQKKAKNYQKMCEKVQCIGNHL